MWRYEKQLCYSWRVCKVILHFIFCNSSVLYFINRLYEYFNDKLFPSQCGFYKGYSSQYCLLVMTDKFKESTDKGNAFGALLTDLSKAFDHILLMTNLFAFRILLLSLKLIHSYL